MRHHALDGWAIPEGWTEMAFKRAFRLVASGNAVIKNTASGDPGEGLFPAFSASGQDIWLPRFDHRGQGLVLSAVGARCGKCFLASDKWSAIANTHVLLPKERFAPSYLWYVANDETFWLKGGSAQPYVQVGDSLARDWFSPPLPTQKAIADFLDRKTAAIDALIEKKQKLLDLLAEKRAALINQAVTKGLDPNVPMKDSGIPWIGEIPAHWVVKRLQFACVLQRGFDLPSQARADGDVPIYGGGGITGHHAQAMVMPPGVVTGRYGTIGEVHLVDVPFWPLNTSLYVKQFWGNNAAYIRHLLSAAPMKMYSAKSAVPGVDRNDVHVIPVGMPPVPEQETIVAQLDARLAGLDEVVGAISTHVGRLQEYRQALITAAVTGKLRVEAAP